MTTYISGMGAMTSLGLDVNTTFNSILENKTGVRHFPNWEAYNGLYSHLGAPVANYDVAKIPRQVRRSMSRMSEMAALASMQALGQADLSDSTLNSDRTLIIMGSTSGSPNTLESYFKLLFERGGPQGQVSTSFFKVMNHSVAANVAAALNYKGPMLAPSSACATSSQALILGWELMQTGLYDCVIAGGADEIHFVSAAIFDIVLAASRGYNARPDEASRPFDKDRDGLVVSEGSGILVMETEEHLRRRGGRALAEFKGGAYTCDGSHMSQSSGEAMQRTMSLGLKRAGLEVKDIDYVNAHATGTLQGDAEEAMTIAKLFGDKVPVSSLKGHLGHSHAACGAIEAIAPVLMLQNKVILPTRNLIEPDRYCSGIDLVKEKREANLQNIISNNFAFGGVNTSLVLSKTGEGI